MSKVSMKLASSMYALCMKKFKSWGKRLKVIRLCFRKMLPLTMELLSIGCVLAETDSALHQSHLILMQSYDIWPINYFLPQTGTWADSNYKFTYSCFFHSISNFLTGVQWPKLPLNAARRQSSSPLSHVAFIVACC